MCVCVCLRLSCFSVACCARLLKAQRCVSATTVHFPIEQNKSKPGLPVCAWLSARGGSGPPYGRGAASICIHQVTESRAADSIVPLLLHNNPNILFSFSHERKTLRYATFSSLKSFTDAGWLRVDAESRQIAHQDNWQVLGCQLEQTEDRRVWQEECPSWFKEKGA